MAPAALLHAVIIQSAQLTPTSLFGALEFLLGEKGADPNLLSAILNPDTRDAALCSRPELSPWSCMFPPPFIRPHNMTQEASSVAPLHLAVIMGSPAAASQLLQ